METNSGLRVRIVQAVVWFYGFPNRCHNYSTIILVISHGPFEAETIKNKHSDNDNTADGNLSFTL